MTTRVSRYQKGKTNLDFTEASDSEWQWHQLGHMQIYSSLQTGNHANTPPLSFLQAGSAVGTRVKWYGVSSFSSQLVIKNEVVATVV